ncbi:MAG: type I glyceraldehyde-3-phosphate dehydrogenase [Candidatus Diapherotrites archaeon]|uniref:glyceraldehyde-3-phosphate dehydrogenase (NAD(P)(+)) (phosphorylating) n=1 Tax=Candidatus Iainarchaeum sp. TaxID=3101447 RepID=A0A938YUY3_9ARCH|nr:type I glyceraldehyde-3-phosphate dehydrogenase [Candidatus Diapherotrites archaeon]
MVKVAINGFGRIGRQAFKAMLKDKKIEVAAVNDLTDNATLARLLQYDSVYGKFQGTVSSDSENLIVDGKKIKVLAERDPTKLPWKKLGIDIVLESTGIFRDKQQAEMHLDAGAKKVVISAPPKGTGCNQYILNINSDKYNAKSENVVSMASCTTNCLAPMVKVLQEGIGIGQGFMTTIHAYTSDQVLVDGPHKDARRARSAAINMIPTSTGAAKAITKIFTELEGRLDGIAVRVPVPTGSLTDLTCVMQRETTVEEVNGLFRRAASKDLKRNLLYSEHDIVSTDIIGGEQGCIFDSKLTSANGKLVKVLGWYDNEAGYSSLLSDFIVFLAKKGL